MLNGGRWSWTASAVFCLVGFVGGYTFRTQMNRYEEQQLPVQRYWDQAARSRWPGLAGWSDAQIRRMLGTPVGFRSAFDECSTKDDVEIGKIASSEPKDIFDEVSLCFPPLPKGYVLDRPVSKASGAIPATWRK